MQQRWEEEERRGTAMQKACSELKCQADQQGHHCMHGENKRIIRLIMPAQTSAPVLHAMPGRTCIHSYLVNSPLLSALRVCFQPFLSLTEEFFLTTSNLGRVTGGKKNPLKLQDK
jgi:hypothetical protein